MLFFDSNIFIFANIEEYPEHTIAVKKIEETLQKGKICVNSIIVSEIYHKLFRLINREEAKTRTKKILESEGVVFLPIERRTIMKAIDISSSLQIRINDSIIAQHVIDVKGDGIVTDNVKDFKKIEKLKVIPLRT